MTYGKMPHYITQHLLVQMNLFLAFYLCSDKSYATPLSSSTSHYTLICFV